MCLNQYRALADLAGIIAEAPANYHAQNVLTLLVWCSPLPPPKGGETTLLYKTCVICIAFAFAKPLLQPYPIFPFHRTSLAILNVSPVLVLRVCVVYVEKNNDYK